MSTRTSAILLGIACAQALMAQLPPVLTKSFTPATIAVGDVTTLTLTLTNPNTAGSLTNLQVTDTVPPTALQFQFFGAGSNCSVASINLSTNQMSVTQNTLLPLASCKIDLVFKALAPGSVVNVTSQVTSSAELPGAAATADLTIVQSTLTRDTPVQVRYAANLNLGESYINITNDGATGAPLLGPGFGGAVGNICVNVYAFSPDEQLVSCCSCLVTPNGVVNLGVNRDLTSKTLTGVIPTSVAVVLVATSAGVGGSGTTCTNSAATLTTATLAIGMNAWGSTIHNAPPAAPGYFVTATPFSGATLGAGELASLSGRCASIIGNGSGFGICRSCQAGALGANRTF